MAKPKQPPAPPEMMAAYEAASIELSTVPSDGALEQLSQLVDQASGLALEIERRSAELSQMTLTHTQLVADRIPSLMDTIGVADLTTRGGLKVEIRPHYGATLSASKDETADAAASRRRAALAWLRANGHDGIVRDELSVDMGKGSGDAATKLKGYLRQIGLAFSHAETVHPSTLKAFVREQIEAPGSHEFPRELFRASVARIAAIKKKR
jgi:hypothetical protein